MNESSTTKMRKALKTAQKPHDNSIGDCLYDCGIEKEDTKSIVEFLAMRIEDQYYSSAPSKEVSEFVKKLKSIAEEIEDYIII